MLRLHHLVFIAFLFCIYASCASQQKINPHKINGVSFVAPPKEFPDSLMLLPRKKVSANWICLMPYAFVGERKDSIRYNESWQWWGEKVEGAKAMNRNAKSKGYRVLLKPQLWIRHGEFTGLLKFDKEEEWLMFEQTYRNFIMEYAKLAEEEGIEIFCIGTELEAFVMQRKAFWNNLIKDIRNVYHGKLTYAANWDEYSRVPFWEHLDYIGIDAYFPLSESKSPSVEELITPLTKLKNELAAFSYGLERPVLFTEYGFRSTDFNTKEPWNSDRKGEVNLIAQENAYQAFYEIFWQENFISGGFIWKWFPNYYEVGGPNNNRFTPQNKPVEQVIKKTYQSFN